MRAHEPGAVFPVLLCAAKQFGMDEIDRADVEGRGHAHLAAKAQHPFNEIEARSPEVETAVDMAPLDIDEATRIDCFGETHEEPHRERRARPVRAGQEFAIKRGEFEGHWGHAIGGRSGRSMCAPAALC